MSNDDDQDLLNTLSQIEALLNFKRFDHAKRLIASALERYPDNHDLLYFAGWVEWQQDNTEEALRLAQRLIAMSPDSYRGRSLLADIHVELHNFADAERVLIGLLKDYPENADQLASYAIVMLMTMHIDKARRLAHEALRIAPDNALGLRASLLVSLIEGKKIETDETLAELIKKRPDTMMTAWSMVHVLNEKGDHRGALRIAQEMIEAQPADQELVDTILALKLKTHWTMLPLWPMQRFGWGGSIALWFALVISLRLMGDSPLSGAFALIFLGYVVYSWVWPGILMRLLRR